MKKIFRSLKNNFMGIVMLLFAIVLLTINAVVAFNIYNAISGVGESKVGTEGEEIFLVSLKTELFEDFEENQKEKYSFTSGAHGVSDYWGAFKKQRDVFLE